MVQLGLGETQMLDKIMYEEEVRRRRRGACMKYLLDKSCMETDAGKIMTRTR